MGFLNDLPDYKNYVSTDYHMTDVPNEHSLWEGLSAFANRADNFKSIINKLRNIALISPATNSNRPWLDTDLEEAFKSISQKTQGGKIHFFYDAVACIAKEAFLDEDEVNDFLSDYCLGYEISKCFNEYVWHVRDDTLNMSENIDKTLVSLEKTPFDQAVENLQQAKIQFQNPSNERALKDAVRDCASAMESIINILGANDDIKKSSRNMRDSKLWGLDDIVKDGESIFKKLHHLYPDFRHGSTGMSSMTMNEAKYWADRMVCFISYILRQKEKLDFSF